MININKVSVTYSSPLPVNQTGPTDIIRLEVLERQVLKDITLSIPKGETVSITGPNGAGKTTLLKVMAGLATPSSGIVAIKHKPDYLFGLPQGYNANLSLRDFLFKSKFSPLTSRRILKFCSLLSLADMPFTSLSLGMQAKLLSTTLLFRGSKILLLDDIFFLADLDFCQKFLERAQEQVVVVAHHEPKELPAIGRIIKLHNGQMEE